MAEKPKRPLSSYMIWLSSARVQMKKEYPDFKVTEIAKKGGELWRNMKPNDKKEWEEKAAVLKQNYNIAVKEFERHGGVMSATTSKKRGKAPAARPAKMKKTVELSDEEESD